MDDPYPAREAIAYFSGEKWEAESWFGDDPNIPEAFLINIIGYDKAVLKDSIFHFWESRKCLARYSFYLRRIPDTTFIFNSSDRDVPLASYSASFEERIIW